MEVWNNSNPSSFEDDTTANVPGSYRPVSFDLRQDNYLNAIVDIDNALVGVPFYLSGKLGTDENVVFNSDPQFFKSTGSRTISMKVKPDWSTTDFPWALVGTVVWRLEISPTKQICQLNSSRLEFYALTPTLPNFFANKIKVGVLRAIVLPARSSGETDWVTYCIKAAFGKYGFSYYDGKKAFAETSSGGNFQLRRWTSLINTGTYVNCWDQAGIVQIEIGLGLNSSTQWKYMEPYGYLVKTQLIGIGECNNPFCKRDGTPAVIGNNDSKRTQFGSHTFITVSSKSNNVGDATVGPHLASETLPQYVDASIQKTSDTTLYSTTGTQPGTAANAGDRHGITSIDEFDSSSGSASASSAALAVMSKAATTGVGSPISFTNLDIGRIHELFSQKIHRGGDVLYHAHDISPTGSHIAWVFATEGGPTTVDIVIRDSNEGAKNYLAHHLNGYSQPVEDLFKPAPADIAKGDVCFVSITHKQSEMIWIRGNVFASVAGPADIHTLNDNILEGIDKVFVAGTKLPSGGGELIQQRPTIHGINIPKKVKVGQEFSAYASVRLFPLFRMQPLTCPFVRSRTLIAPGYSTGLTILLSSSPKTTRPTLIDSEPKFREQRSCCSLLRIRSLGWSSRRKCRWRWLRNKHCRLIDISRRYLYF